MVQENQVQVFDDRWGIKASLDIYIPGAMDIVKNKIAEELSSQVDKYLEDNFTKKEILSRAMDIAVEHIIRNFMDGDMRREIINIIATRISDVKFKEMFYEFLISQQGRR